MSTQHFTDKQNARFGFRRSAISKEISKRIIGFLAAYLIRPQDNVF